MIYALVQEKDNKYHITRVPKCREKDISDGFTDRTVYFEEDSKSSVIYLYYKYDDASVGAAFAEGLSRFEMWNEDIKKRASTKTIFRIIKSKGARRGLGKICSELNIAAIPEYGFDPDTIEHRLDGRLSVETEAYDYRIALARGEELIDNFIAASKEKEKKLYITVMTKSGEITTRECRQEYSASLKTDTPVSDFGYDVHIYHYAEDEIEAEKKALLTIFHELRDIIVKNQNKS